jgi:hypothetical protein
VTVIVAVLTTAISVVMLLATQEVANAGALFAAILVASLIYGSIGSLLSVYVRGDLEGSFVIILIFMLDAFVGGPLAAGKGIFADVLPVHFPSELAVSAMVGLGAEDEWWLWSLAYLAAVSVPAVIAVVRRRAAQ